MGRRASAEEKNAYSVPNHAHNYAKAVVLHRKVIDAPMPSFFLKYLPFGIFHTNQEKMNKANKEKLMDMDLDRWFGGTKQMK